MSIRVGVVGAGKMGLSHFAIANALPGVSVAAVCDTSRYVLSVLKKYAGVETYPGAEEMIEKGKLDCIIVATPTSTHFAVAKQAIEKGLHLFVEKPLTLSAAQSRTLSDLARQRKVVNQVGFHNRFIGTFMRARALIREGALGTVTNIHGSAFGQVVVKEQGSTWRSRKSEGGGCLHDYACHVVDLMNFLVGPPSKVSGARMQRIFSNDVEDAVSAVFDYESAMSGILETNWSDDTVRKMSTTIVVHGTRGKLVVDRQELKVYLRAGCPFEGYEEGWNTGYITELQRPVPFYLRGEEYSAQIDYFAHSVKERRLDGQNSFATALDADRVVARLLDDASGTAVSPGRHPRQASRPSVWSRLFG